MIKSSEFGRFLQTLFPKAGNELLSLYESAAEYCGLRYTELCTVHDLLDLSGYINEEPLHALLIIMFAALQEGSVCIQMAEKALAIRLAQFSEADGARNDHKAPVMLRRKTGQNPEHGCPCSRIPKEHR